MRRKKIFAFAAAGVLMAAGLVFLNALLKPKYMGAIVEGAMIEEYYEDPTGHDVVFIGDCEVYENFSPITLWEEYGITSYIRGSAQQLIWQSYYLLEDTLRYETPDVVVFNVLSMKYNEPQKEAYNRMSLDGMRWSSSKWKAVQASMMEDEKMLDYIFPLLRYHSRWSELESDDFKYLWKKDKVTHNGYYMRVDQKPAGTFPKGKKLGNYQFGDNAYYYLDKMTQLCQEKGIELVLIKAPSIYPYWYDEWDQQMVDYANEHGLKYYNFLELSDTIGIDMTTDTYDGGLHMNLSGAEKMSHYFGKILREECKVPDRRGDAALEAIWQEHVDFYYEMKAKQEQELSEYGYIRQFREE
ncbi:MAG: SGNH/GDSL hydrolase family protein [Lachnospiraceae bacterium]